MLINQINCTDLIYSTWMTSLPIVIGSDRDVIVCTIAEGTDATDVPRAVRLTEDGNIILAIPVVITDDRDVIIRAIAEGTDATNVPGAVGRTEDRNIVLAIPVVVGNDWDVTA